MEEKKIEEVNQCIRDGLKQWADICLLSEADQWAVALKYFPSDIMNVTYLFMHVCSNIGIKAGIIDLQNTEEFGNRLRQLVTDMTGFDPHSFWGKPSQENSEAQEENKEG